MVRLATAEDAAQTTDLLMCVFPQCPKSVRHWHWRHEEDRGFSVVAESQGRIVGHYAVVKQPFRAGNLRLWGGHGQQAVMHPRCRDLKTITAILREVERLAAAQCDFLLAFPNFRMAPLMERLLSWRHVREFPAWELPLATYREAVAARQAAFPAPRCDVRRIETFRDIDGLPGEAPADGELMEAADAEEWQWRYCRHPSQHYPIFAAMADGQCRGAAVLKTYFNGKEVVGHVVRLTSAPDREDVKLALLAKAGEHFALAEVARIVVWNEFRPHRALYAGLGFQPIGFVTNLYAKPLSARMPSVEPAAWSFDMGASDNF
jgi:hypothetical protein